MLDFFKAKGITQVIGFKVNDHNVYCLPCYAESPIAARIAPASLHAIYEGERGSYCSHCHHKVQRRFKDALLSLAVANEKANR